MLRNPRGSFGMESRLPAIIMILSVSVIPFLPCLEERKNMGRREADNDDVVVENGI